MKNNDAQTNTKTSAIFDKTKIAAWRLGIVTITRLILAALIVVQFRSTSAATHSWTGAAGDGRWSTAFNWANSTPPAAGEAASVIVQFPVAGTRHTTNDIPNLTLDVIQISGDNYILAATGGGMNVTLRSSAGLSSTFFITGANALLTGFNFTLATNFTANASISVSPGDTATLRGQFLGPGGLVKRAAGVFVLDGSAPNSYAGRTEIQGGTLRLSQQGVAIPGDLTIGYPALTNLAAVELLAPNQIGDNADILVNPNGAFVPGVFTDTIGSITLSNANLVAGPGLTLQGDFTSSGINLLTGTVRLGGANRIFHVTGHLTADAFIENPTGTAGITKAGPGALELRRANTYNGVTAVNEGTLIVAHANGLGTPSVGTVVTPGTALLIDGNGLTIPEPLTLNGPGSALGSGALWNYSGSNSWTGAITLASDASIGVPNPQTKLTVTGAIGGAGRLTKLGAATLELAGPDANTFAGGLTVEQGALLLNKPAGVTAVRQHLLVGTTNLAPGSSRVVWLNAHQVQDGAPVLIESSGRLELGTRSEEIGALTLRGGGIVAGTSGVLTLGGDLRSELGDNRLDCILALGGVTRTFDVSNGQLLITRDIRDGGGAAGFTKVGDGVLVLDHAITTYTGPTEAIRGNLELRGNATLGQATVGTTFYSGSRLVMSDCTLSEPLTFDYKPGVWVFPNVECSGTNTWLGPLTLNQQVSIRCFLPEEQLTIDSVIAGNAMTGVLVKVGYGLMRLIGSGNNTFPGETIAMEGTLELAKTNGVAIAGPLSVGLLDDPWPVDGAVRLQNHHQIGDSSHVVVHHNGTLDLNGFTDLVGSVDLHDGFIKTGSGQLRLGGDVMVTGSSTIAGRLSLGDDTRQFHVESGGELALNGPVSALDSAAGLTKTGPGDLRLYGTNTFGGEARLLGGDVFAGTPWAFGSAQAGTVVSNNCRITLGGSVQVTNEVMGLVYGQLVGTWDKTNAWHGPITIGQHSVVQTLGTNGLMHLDGVIGGQGNLFFLGNIVLSGAQPNTFTGKLQTRAGLVQLSKTNAVAVPGGAALTIGSDTDYALSFVRLLRAEQLGATIPVDVHCLDTIGGSPHQLDLNGFAQTIGSLEGEGEVRLAQGRLTVGANENDTTFSGRIEGGPTAQLIKIGTGVLTLSGTHAMDGSTRVDAGTLLVNGSLATSAVTVESAGALGGQGTTGSVTCNGGRIIPGASLSSPSFGRLTAGTVSFNSGSTFRCEVGGPLGTAHDQIVVNGFLNIANSILSVQPFGLGALSNQYTIIKIPGGASAFGHFTGLPEGTVFTPTPGRTYRITYAGGASGHDVVLTELVVPQPAQMTGVAPGTNGTMKILGTGTPGLGYELFATTNLTNPAWISLGSVTAGAPDGSLEFIDLDAKSFPQRFYRFVLP
jgi:autotransporter-associated beta strand protein